MSRRLLRLIARRYLWTALTNVLAVVCFLMFLGATPHALTPYVPATVVMVLVLVRTQVRRPGFATARIVVACGLTVGYRDSLGELTVSLSTASLLLIMLTLQEVTVGRLPRSATLITNARPPRSLQCASSPRRPCSGST